MATASGVEVLFIALLSFACCGPVAAAITTARAPAKYAHDISIRHAESSATNTTYTWNLACRQTYPYRWPLRLWSKNTDDPDNDNYAVLDTLEDYRWDGKLTFKLSWPRNGLNDQIWRQTTNPVTKLSRGVDGYEAIQIAYTQHRWGGLEYDGQDSNLDGSVNTWWWHYAVASRNLWHGGYPGPTNPIQQVELWVASPPTLAPTPSPTFAPTEAPTETPTATPTEVPTAIPTEVPTATPTVAPTPEPASAKGDPHLVNMHGQRFDLYQTGVHVLIQVPWLAKPADSLLRVEAEARRLGGSCADLYFEVVNITGSWTTGSGNLQFFANIELDDGYWRHFGDVDLKITRGHTMGGIAYLNLLVKRLSRVKFPVGGLLGEDDHTAAMTPPSDCGEIVDLHRTRRSSFAMVEDTWVRMDGTPIY